MKDDRGQEINLEKLPELIAAARQAFGALVGATAADDSVQGQARKHGIHNRR